MEPGHIEFVHRSWPADPDQLAVIRRELANWLTPLRLTEEETADVVLENAGVSGTALCRPLFVPAIAFPRGADCRM